MNYFFFSFISFIEQYMKHAENMLVICAIKNLLFEIYNKHNTIKYDKFSSFLQNLQCL